jgi:hypothetical protein
MRRRSVWLVAGGLLVVGLGVWGFLSFFERKTIEVFRGYSGEARSNAYYAAARLLDEMGVAEVRTIGEVRELVELPPPGGTLVIPTERTTLSDRLHQRLWDFAQGGGHLIVVTWQLWDDEQRKADPLLDPLGVRQFQAEEPQPEACETEDDAEDCEAAVPSAEVELAGRVLSVQFDPRFSMQDASGTARWWIEDDFGTHLLSYQLGDGRLSVLTDALFMHNRSLADADHAEFVVRLFDQTRFDGPVWILYDEGHPSLWRLVWAHAWMVVVALAVLITAVLWRSASRFGPLTPLSPPIRRELGEHLEASARHAWRWNRGETLLDGMRASLERDAVRRHPGWAHAPRERRRGWLADRSGVPMDAVARALDPKPPSDAADFLERVWSLEAIRRAR